MQEQVPVSRPHIIVKFLDDYKDLPYTDDVQDYLEKNKIIPWGSLKERYPGIDMRRLYTSVSPEQIHILVSRAKEMDPTYRPPTFTTYFVVDVPAGVNPDELAQVFLKFPSVETAYYDPPGESPAVTGTNPRSLGDGNTSPARYLTASPHGINARFAWSVLGGDGAGQDLIDIEKGWTFEHVDLPTRGKVPPEQPLDGDNLDGEHPHGTAVLGVVCGVDNDNGIVGIAPQVGFVKGVSYVKNGQANRPNAILFSINSLPFGGVLLLEVQLLGTNLPIESLKADWDAIRLATALGITVVEAAGNGDTDLDAFPYAAGRPMLSRRDGFWDSGAIMVGAGSSADPHTRVSGSNYGSRIDCFAQGEQVTTTWSNAEPPFTVSDYIDGFDGTSSAAAIVAGVALVVQGISQARRGARLNAGQMRALLTSNGTPSRDPAADRIGVMPDLGKLVAAIDNLNG